MIRPTPRIGDERQECPSRRDRRLAGHFIRRLLIASTADVPKSKEHDENCGDQSGASDDDHNFIRSPAGAKERTRNQRTDNLTEPTHGHAPADPGGTNWRGIDQR